MQKRILVVCDAFPPSFAPRIGNLCKNICSEFDITVVTQELPQKSWTMEIPQEITVHRFAVGSNNRWMNLLHQAGDYLYSANDRRFYQQALKILDGRSFDIVLCFSYYIFPLLSGLKLSKHFQAPLLIDLRDIMEQNAQPEGVFAQLRQFFKLRWLNQWRRNKILRQATVVTTISPWHVTTLSKYNNDVRLIYNGFDANLFFFQEKHQEKFIISYTGRLLDLSLRDPRLFFEAGRQLVADKDFAQHLQIQWFVDQASMREVEQFTHDYQLEPYTLLSPTISAQEMPRILNESSIVLVLSNQASEKGPHGIMTTKFYEALGCERPVLCVRSDEECLEATIRRTQAGCAGHTVEEVKCFIQEKYQEWLQKGYTHQPVAPEEKNKFTRQGQAEQFAEIIRSLLK